MWQDRLTDGSRIQTINFVSNIFYVRYDTCDKIRLPTKLYVNDLDDNVIKVDALEEFEEMREMQVDGNLGWDYDHDS